MTIRVKALSCKEFDAAIADGCVYGEYQGKRGVYVYADLGQELEYIPTPRDNPNTSYKMFVRSSVFFAKTKEQLFDGDFEAEDLPNVTVVVYY